MAPTFTLPIIAAPPPAPDCIIPTHFDYHPLPDPLTDENKEKSDRKAPDWLVLVLTRKLRGHE